MTLIELQKRAQALEKSFADQNNEVASTDGDVTEAQSARYDELFQEAASIRAELSTHGFGVLFRDAAETSQHLIAS